MKDKIEKKGHIGFPITSMVLGIIVIRALLEPSQLDKETILGILSISITSLILGIASIINQTRGRKMAITGIVLSSLGVLKVLELFID